MLRAQRTFVFLTVILLLSTTGCDTPDTVSKFCASSNTTLTSAIPILQDLKGSCLREKNIERGLGSFETVQTDPGCDAIGKQAEGAVAATQVLAIYFNAINSLATFGTAKTASDVSTLVSKTGSAVGAGSAAQTALGSISSFFTTAAISSHQQRSLDKDLTQVSKNIGDVTDALVQIVQANYIDQELKAEEQKLATRYKEFSKNYSGGEVTIELDDRWHADAQSITAKRASAQSLITALNAIKSGSSDMAANAHSIKAKELIGLLDPYVAQLQTLVPQIQKGF
jgi:hypothetical protein